MGLITPDLSGIVDGQVGDAADWTNPFNTLTNEINGNLDTNNFLANGTDLSTIAQSTGWTTWSTTYGGFSANPTQVLRYMKIGRTVHLEAGVPTVNGTSNATTFTMTLPYAAAVNVRVPIWAIDNTGSTVVGRAETNTNSTTLSLYAGIGGTAWTSSGSKAVSFYLTYEATS